jgi:hypothetical protein
MGPEESISQWIGYCDLLARYLPKAAIVDLGGVAVRWLNVRWPSMNACIVDTAVLGRDNLDRRLPLPGSLRQAGIGNGSYGAFLPNGAGRFWNRTAASARP